MQVMDCNLGSESEATRKRPQVFAEAFEPAISCLPSSAPKRFCLRCYALPVAAETSRFLKIAAVSMSCGERTSGEPKA